MFLYRTLRLNVIYTNILQQKYSYFKVRICIFEKTIVQIDGTFFLSKIQIYIFMSLIRVIYNKSVKIKIEIEVNYTKLYNARKGLVGAHIV